MRYREIVCEVGVISGPDRLALLPVMYGVGALDGEIEAEKLEAARLENARLRAEIDRIRADIDVDSASLDSALARAKIAKVEAEAAATLAKL